MKIAALLLAAVAWAGKTSQLTLSVERRDSTGQVALWGTAVAKLAVTKHGDKPSDGDWVTVAVVGTAAAPGSRTQYTIEYALDTSAAPGAGVLEAGREYTCWLLVTDGALRSQLVAGVVQAK